MDIKYWRGFIVISTVALSSFSLATSAHGNSRMQFGAATNYSITGSTGKLVVGDFNNDDKLDIASANLNGSAVTLLLGNGDGSFAAPVNVAVAHAPRTLAAGHFNEDNHLDLITVNIGNYPSNFYTILLGNGAGGFAITNFLCATNGSSTFNAVGVADIDGDGSLDFAMCGIGLQVYSGSGDGKFSFVTNYTVGNPSYDIAFGNLNNDIKPDIVTGNYSSSSMSVLLNNGSGAFFSPTNYSGDHSEYHHAVLARDFNSDGQTDLVTINQYNRSVGIRLSTGNGIFGLETRFPTGLTPYTLECADFDSDGFLDLVTTSQFSNPSSLAILPGNGDGTFATAITNFIGNGSQSIAVADFNKDGRPDIASGHNFPASISIRLNQSAPTLRLSSAEWKGSTNLVFTNPVPTSFAVGVFPVNATVADFNGDGSLDVATPDASNGGRVAVRFNDGNGNFGTISNFSVSATPSSVATGDFNGDGKADLVSANTGTNNVSVLLGNGIGGFAAATNFPVGNSPRLVVVGNFNNDTNADLAVSSIGSPLFILLGQGDGSFGAASNVFSAGAISLAAGYFNSDGNLDLVTVDANNGIHLLFGNGDGTFTTNGTVTLGGPIVVEDFNQDGHLDVAARKFGSCLIMLGDGEGGFVTNTFPANLSGAVNLAVADLNFDNKPDLIGVTSSSLTALLGVGDGTFIMQTNVFATPGSTFLFSADVNLDGKVDILTTANNANVLRRYINQTAPAQPAALTIGSRAKLQWPNDLGFVLESSTNLSFANGWVAVTNSYSTMNEVNVLTNRVGGEQLFYRLRSP